MGRPSRACEEPGGPARASAYLLYGWTCKLGAQLERLRQLVASDRVHVVFMDDVKEAPQAVFTGLLNFLGLAPFTPEFRTVNEAKTNRLPFVRQIAIKIGATKRALGIKHSFGILAEVGRWNGKTQRWQADAQMTAVLRSYFRQDVALLGQLTGRDLSHWLR